MLEALADQLVIHAVQQQPSAAYLSRIILCRHPICYSFEQFENKALNQNEISIRSDKLGLFFS